ncbi:hypothetical protein Taro_050873 [Colocasia esculenta]|uniref:Uncharacterized protein n=1 Tax=Colocasia esculenta TaxID=4460 RepID=A0A843XF47_COLES|nr:hypothetical protein [Colocasia esculenta]
MASRQEHGGRRDSLRTGPDRPSPVSRPTALSRLESRRKFEMADRRDWGGGGDDPEESTQHMIERIWESLTDIRARMDQQALVPPVVVPPGDGEAIPIASVPPEVEVPFVAPVPPLPPVLLAEEPVMQVEKFPEIAAAYLLRRAESRYSETLGS